MLVTEFGEEIDDSRTLLPIRREVYVSETAAEHFLYVGEFWTMNVKRERP
jgi:hypothetical protein